MTDSPTPSDSVHPTLSSDTRPSGLGHRLRAAVASAKVDLQLIPKKRRIERLRREAEPNAVDCAAFAIENNHAIVEPASAASLYQDGIRLKESLARAKAESESLNSELSKLDQKENGAQVRVIKQQLAQLSNRLKQDGASFANVQKNLGPLILAASTPDSRFEKFHASAAEVNARVVEAQSTYENLRQQRDQHNRNFGLNVRVAMLTLMLVIVASVVFAVAKSSRKPNGLGPVALAPTTQNADAPTTAPSIAAATPLAAYPKAEPPRAEPPPANPPQAEPPKKDPPKADPPKSEPPRSDPPKAEPPKVDPPKPSPPPADPPKVDPPRTEPPPTALKSKGTPFTPVPKETPKPPVAPKPPPIAALGTAKSFDLGQGISIIVPGTCAARKDRDSLIVEMDSNGRATFALAVGSKDEPPAKAPSELAETTNAYFDQYKDRIFKTRAFLRHGFFDEAAIPDVDQINVKGQLDTQSPTLRVWFWGTGDRETIKEMISTLNKATKVDAPK